MKTLFKDRQLSRNQAKAISKSQSDLGGLSQKDMAIALGGIKPNSNWEDDAEAEAERLLNVRIEAYERLDALSKFIVKEFLEQEDIEGAKDAIRYVVNNLEKASEATND